MYLSRGDCPQRVLKLVRYPATRFLGEPPTGVKFNIVCVYVCVCVYARASTPIRVCGCACRTSERCVGSTVVVSYHARHVRRRAYGCIQDRLLCVEEKAESSIDPSRRDLRPYEIGTLMMVLTHACRVFSTVKLLSRGSRSIRLAINSLLESIAINARCLSILSVRFE